MLRKHGHAATQSSVSRDLRELGVAKQGRPLRDARAAAAVKNDFSTLKQFVRAIMTAGTNLTVLRTTIGRGAERGSGDRHRPMARGRSARFPGTTPYSSQPPVRATSTSSANAFTPSSDAKISMTSTYAQGAEPILLAFSGGLDTSFCVPWLKDTYKRPVITVTVDTGGIDAERRRSRSRERSAELGRHRASSDRRARRLLRAGAQIPDHGQYPPRRLVSPVRGRGASAAGADHRADGPVS